MTKQKSRIVVVEDEQALQSVMVEWLQSEGHEAYGITTGAQAFEKIPEIMPDLIFMDIILPEMNGLEVVARLKADPKIAKIPVIVMTNLALEEERKKAESLGVKEYLIKTDYDFASLNKIIKKYLNAV